MPAQRASDPDQCQTHQRLLEAAGEVFAEVGFRHATVRDICRRADANVAAVNYHFGDKERLYDAVLRYAHRCAMGKYSADAGTIASSDVKKRLEAFVRSFLLRILERGELAWYGKLSSREMMDPTPALQRLVDQEIRPRVRGLESIVRELLGKKATIRQVRWCAQSIAGQCLYHHHARPVLSRLYPDQTYGPKDIDALADHITQFSLAGLKAMRTMIERGKKR